MILFNQKEDIMAYLNSKQIALIWGVGDRQVRKLCAEGKVDGALLDGKTWKIPEDAQKPIRTNARKLSLNEKINKINELKQQLDSKRPLTPAEVDRLNEEFMVNYTYDSNAIEGNTLTLQETTLVLQGITIDKKPLKHHMEAIGHKEAFYFIVDLVKDKKPLSEALIKQIHSLVLMGSPEDKGAYRRLPVTIMGASHIPPQPYLIQKQMEDLMINYKKWTKTKNIVQLVSLLHLNFEFIHPFIDGNGRTGRLLINLILMRHGYPPINIKFEDRIKYYNCFEDYYKIKKPTAMANLVADLLISRLEQYIHVLN